MRSSTERRLFARTSMQLSLGLTRLFARINRYLADTILHFRIRFRFGGFKFIRFGLSFLRVGRFFRLALSGLPDILIGLLLVCSMVCSLPLTKTVRVFVPKRSGFCAESVRVTDSVPLTVLVTVSDSGQVSRC